MSTDQTTPTSLARVDIDAAHALYAAGDGARLVRDTDLGRWAGLSQPRDIRRTIDAALRDGALTIAGAAPDGRGPTVHEVIEHVAIGSGATRQVTARYLGEEGALLVATRLRTERAIRLTREIVTVFAAVRRGEVPQATALPAPPPALADQLPAEENLAALPPDVARAALLTRVSENASCPPAARARACELVIQLLAGTIPALPAPAPAPVEVQPATTTAAPPAPQPVEPALAPQADEDAPAPPAAWLSPSSMAARASVTLGRRVSPQAVGHALALLGYHDAGPDVRRGRLVPRAHGADGDAVSWRYRPDVYPAVLAYLRAQGPGPKKAAPRGAYAADARGVIDALADADPCTTTPRPRPQPSAHHA